MDLEVLPAVREYELTAIGRALLQAGVKLDERPEAYASAWRRAAALEATDNEPVPVRYAPSPRSTRGATRA